MKKIIGITFIGIFMSFGLFAQRTERSGNRLGRNAVTVEERVAAMDKQLHLTDEQKTELTAFFNQNEVTIKEQREKREANRSAARAEAEKKRSEYQAELKKILGEEKYAAWNDSRSQRTRGNYVRNTRGEDRGDVAQRSERSGNRNAAITNRSTTTPKEQAERLSEQLQLTDSQKAQLEQHFTEMKNARSQDLQNSAETRSERRSRAQARQEANDAKLKEILGEKKFKELQEGRAQRRANRR